MKYDDIEVGKKYNIVYIDPFYPCGCPCHSNLNIRHCVPCCRDNGYTGEAYCIQKCEYDDRIPDKLVSFELSNKRILRVEPKEIYEIL